MNDLDLILTLTGSLAAALVCGYVTLRLGLSPIVGYLLAGLVVGPYTPGFTANKHLADQLAEIGVILLMFGVGLQFHVQELLAVRRVAVPGALGRCLVATGLGALVGIAYGWGWSAGLVFGLALSIASTVVLMRVLADSGDLQTPAGHIAVGWLVVEDLLTVLVLVLLPAVFAPGIEPGGIVLAVVVALVKVAGMVALTFFLGDRLIPWLLERAAATRSRELFTLTVLVVALGIAVGSVKLFGVSMALGAFLAGMVVGRTRVQPEGGDRRFADAGRFRRLILRLGRHPVSPAIPSRIARASGCGPRHRLAREATGGLRHRCLPEVPTADCPLGSSGHGPNRRVLLHPGHGR